MDERDLTLTVVPASEFIAQGTCERNSIKCRAYLDLHRSRAPAVQTVTVSGKQCGIIRDLGFGTASVALI